MKGVYLYEEEINELYEFLTAKRDDIFDYIKSRNLSFGEGNALLAACDKIEKEMKGEEKIDI